MRHLMHNALGSGHTASLSDHNNDPLLVEKARSAMNQAPAPVGTPTR